MMIVFMMVLMIVFIVDGIDVLGLFDAGLMSLLINQKSRYP